MDIQIMQNGKWDVVLLLVLLAIANYRVLKYTMSHFQRIKMPKKVETIDKFSGGMINVGSGRDIQPEQSQ